MKYTLHYINFLLLCSLASFAQRTVKGEIEAFAAATGSLPTIDKATGSLSFLRFSAGRAYQGNGGDAQQKTMNFISQNSRIFGIRPDKDAFRFMEKKSDNLGLEHITVQQTFKGVPVFDGLMKFHYNKSGGVTAVNGNFISDIKVNPVPTLAQHEAEAIAVKYVQGDELTRPAAAAPLRAKKSSLYIFQKGLAQGYNGAKYLVYEVEVGNDADVREFLYVDAHTGALVEQFTGMHGIDRKLFETAIDPANLKWEEADGVAGPKYTALDKWQKSEVDVAEHIYNLMKNTFGYVSFDGHDKTMITTNNNPDIKCPNANWNGVSANYCTGTASNDVVAHEWAHAYTEFTSGLIYQWQPGALNEAYSDIWGETVDQLGNYMDEGDLAGTGDNILRGDSCGGSSRWKIGEKAEAFGGSIRDMRDPNCNGHPAKVSDPLYHCFSTDNGGVHINSGVLNHAYALLVDGGTYNNKTITGIGLIKAAHIFWRAQLLYMTKTTDFEAQADHLEQALQDLLASGTNLRGLSIDTVAAGLSGQTITQADAIQLANVIEAVELRRNNNCDFSPLFKPVATLCEGARPELAIFSENFEAGLGSFVATHETASATWAARNWVQVDAPSGKGGKAAFALDHAGDDCKATDQTGLLRLQSPIIKIPVGTAGNLSMAFDHYVAVEAAWDGGNIKFSKNNGAWTLLPATAFIANGYNDVLNATAVGNGNPIQGQPAFSGTDDGHITGSWGQSQIDLTSIGLVAGDSIRFRWEMGTDGCGGQDGWYIDDIRVYTCAVTPAVHFALENTAINEGEAVSGAECLRYIDKTVAVQIDKAPSQPVTITFNTPAGTATMGATSDYTVTPSSITLQPGTLTQNVTVRVYNDAYVEGEETIELSYTVNSNGGDGYASSGFQKHIFTITDDDLTPGNYTDTLLNSGFNVSKGGWAIQNGGNDFHSWEIASFNNAALDPGGRPFFFANSSIKNGQAIIMDEIIESPPINTAGKKNVVLTFSQDWRPFIGDFKEQGFVEVWDGSTWHNILTQNEQTGRRGNMITGVANVQKISIPEAFTNMKMKVRFRYMAKFDFWWAIDNITVTSSNSTAILSAANTGDVQYIGPNQTAVFYDPATGGLLAKIKNMSGHDYGCTTVAIDRAGVDTVAWLGKYHITNKTFKVTPANNNEKGKYEITLYYKASELPNFNGPAIKSMGKSKGGIGTGNTAATSFAEVQVSSAFNTDFAFSSVFDSGFSGFGLSDAPPAGALPVTLTEFSGKHSPEGNQLEWKTTAETNNAYFVVQKMSGKNFTEIGQIIGNGNSAVINHYRFLDVNYHKGISYYRLKQVDFDGQWAYSRIIPVNAQNYKAPKFFPNPVQSVLTVELSDAEMKEADVRVINSVGQQVLHKEKVKIVDGIISVDLSMLPIGIFQINFQGEKSSCNLSVFKR
jgi:Zn-dependent metalloprotease